MKLYSTSDPTVREPLARVDSRTDAWRDAIGTSYAIGPSPLVLETITRQTRRGYCTRHAR